MKNWNKYLFNFLLYGLQELTPTYELQKLTPTVVDLATVTNECIDIFIENLQEKAMSNDYLNKLKERDNYEDIKEALVPKDYNMIVTPKEIDKLIENMSKIISKAINMAM